MRNAGRAQLAEALTQCRKDTLVWATGLRADQYRVARCATVNLPLWEFGHIGWFQERWCVRRSGVPSLRADADRLYDSSAVAHAMRWQLALPTMGETVAYLEQVLAASLDTLARCADDDHGLYFHRLALFHELMHQEAFACTWHNLGYPAPDRLHAGMPRGRVLQPRVSQPGLSLRGLLHGESQPPPASPASTAIAGSPATHEHADDELAFDRDSFKLGADPGATGFVFDNEKWAQREVIAPFRIDCEPVRNRGYLDFVNDGGYSDPQWWDKPVWSRLQAEQHHAPAGWRRRGNDWTVRWFDTEHALEPDAAVMQISAFEAQAWCRWAGRRLPTEAQWAYAAQHADLGGKHMRWGDEVWEWTASDFLPFDGFRADAYADYSAPWFGTHRAVRGASLATAPALVHHDFRNFYEPHRHDPFVGFRSCVPA